MNKDMTIENMKLREKIFSYRANNGENLISSAHHLRALKKMEIEHFYILARKYDFLDEKLCQV